MLTSKENKVDTTTISKYVYTVNPIGQRTSLAQTGTAFATAKSIEWGYDPLGQVTSVDSSENTQDRAYQYDTIGNRQKSAESLTFPVANNYTTNALNQYTQILQNSVNSVINYDDDGNTLTEGNKTHTWDAENRLIKIQIGETEVNYQYDSQSRRITRTEGSDKTIIIYDAWNNIAEFKGNDGVPPLLSKTYTWGIDLSNTLQGAGGVGGLLMVTEHAPTEGSPATAGFFPTYDANGNISEYLNTTGTIVAHFEYDPFGKTVAATGPKANDFTHRFSTKPLDAETGLYNYVFRLYNPISGRWESRDPIEERGGVNLYGFVGNDGVNRADILGLTKCEGKADLGNRKFSLKETYLGGVTRKGKPAEQIIELAQDLLNDIQNLGRLQAVGNIAAGGVIGGIQGMVPDATVLALGEANPDLVDFIGGKLGEINRGIGNNPAKGAMITVEYQCLKCICTDEDDWYNPADWFQSGDIYGWDDPDIQQQSYSVELEGDLIEFENRKFVLYKTVKEITLQDIVDAVERSRESCEK